MIKKTAAKVSKFEREQTRMEMRNCYGMMTQRTTRGTFRRPKQNIFQTATGSGEARWA